MRLYYTFLIVQLFALDALASAWASADGLELHYGGDTHDMATVESVQKQVAPLIPEAVAAAEDLLDLALDPGRCRIQLHDIVKKAGGRTLKMRTTGGDTMTVLVFIEPILRGYLRDSEDILRTLKHEFIHVIVRQHVATPDYGELPIWFREGVPHYLLGQGEEKLLNGLGAFYKNPYALLGGLGRGTHFAEPEVAGYFFFAHLDEQLGRDRLLRFIRDVLESGSTDGGFAGLSPQDLGIADDDTRKVAEIPATEFEKYLDELWAAADRRARSVLSGHVDEVAEALFECMSLSRRGPKRNAIALECFRDLIARYPESYAAEIAHYQVAMCYYRIPDYDASGSYFAKFVQFERDYGLLDDARYYELMIKLRSGTESAEVLRAAEDYLRLFPEAKKARDVKKVVASLAKKIDAAVPSE